jgi:hypothetical protein
MPLWHGPDPHIPAPQSATFAGAPADLACAAKVEYCVVKCSWPHDGQRTSFASFVRLKSFSNFVPQSSQEYSKIGMLLE